MLLQDSRAVTRRAERVTGVLFESSGDCSESFDVVEVNLDEVPLSVGLAVQSRLLVPTRMSADDCRPRNGYVIDRGRSGHSDKVSASMVVGGASRYRHDTTVNHSRAPTATVTRGTSITERTPPPPELAQRQPATPLRQAQPQDATRYTRDDASHGPDARQPQCDDRDNRHQLPR